MNKRKVLGQKSAPQQRVYESSARVTAVSARLPSAAGSLSAGASPHARAGLTRSTARAPAGAPPSHTAAPAACPVTAAEAARGSQPSAKSGGTLCLPAWHRDASVEPPGQGHPENDVSQSPLPFSPLVFVI